MPKPRIAIPTPASLLLLVLVSLPSIAQPPKPTSAPIAPAPADTDAIGPSFEVATVRPSSPTPTPGGWMGFRLLPSGHLSVRGIRLISLVSYTYAPRGSNSRVDGGSAWASSQPYDIEAKIDESQMQGWDKLTDDQRTARVRPMLRALLAERFHLKLHTEMRETPVYALLQAKGGAKLKQVAAPEPVEEGDELEKVMRVIADHPGQAAPGFISCTGSGCTGKAVPMEKAVSQIGASAGADRIVIRDPDALTPMQQIEDQLGLRFQSRKIPMKTYIIDAAEKPTQN